MSRAAGQEQNLLDMRVVRELFLLIKDSESVAFLRAVKKGMQIRAEQAKRETKKLENTP